MLKAENQDEHTVKWMVLLTDLREFTLNLCTGSVLMA